MSQRRPGDCHPRAGNSSPPGMKGKNMARITLNLPFKATGGGHART